MSDTNEIELHRLDKLISDLQWLIFTGGGSQASTTSMLVKTLTEAQSRSAGIQRSEEIAKGEKDRKQHDELAAALVIAEREVALSQEERQEFASFLKCEFFTKGDFGKLDQFYTHTWDRLSEDGKSEMSKRVWKGVRNGEYQFIELPESVKDKEAERIQRLLSRDSIESSALNVTATDRQDFLNAHERT